MRSRLGLHGNTLNVDVPAWERHDSGTGAGIDSFYEYLLKVSLTARCSLFCSCSPLNDAAANPLTPNDGPAATT